MDNIKSFSSWAPDYLIENCTNVPERWSKSFNNSRFQTLKGEPWITTKSYTTVWQNLLMNTNTKLVLEKFKDPKFYAGAKQSKIFINTLKEQPKLTPERFFELCINNALFLKYKDELIAPEAHANWESEVTTKTKELARLLKGSQIDQFNKLESILKNQRLFDTFERIIINLGGDPKEFDLEKQFNSYTDVSSYSESLETLANEIKISSAGDYTHKQPGKSEFRKTYFVRSLVKQFQYFTGDSLLKETAIITGVVFNDDNYTEFQARRAST
tara:strand:- start:5480 stop:6292 length:813 start_codon:yes stop_codon:yes gene_type:complete